MRGMVLGKFMPPHRGHIHLIREAMRQCDDLTIVVGTLRDEPIPGSLRCAWMRALFPEARVVHLTDENPQHPHEHPRFWEIWRASLLRVLPHPIEVVFSSETYGDRLALELGAARHVCVDLDRSTVPVSATRVRRDPDGAWDLIAWPARPWHVRRVCVYGPESTGKTTLTRQLAEHYDTIWVPEYARPYLDRANAERVLPTPESFVIAEDIPEIAKGHARTEDAAATLARRVVFIDTDLVTTTLYSDFYFGACPEAVRREADRRTYDLTLLLDVDVPWVADPLRDQPDDRGGWMARFRGALEARQRPYTLVRGGWKERFETACTAVDALLSEDTERACR